MLRMSGADGSRSVRKEDLNQGTLRAEGGSWVL